MMKKLLTTNRSFVVFGCLLLGLIRGCPQCPPITSEKNPFTLAYIDQDWRLRIRWSDDGINWSSASAAASTIDKGPGVTSDTAGLMYIIVFDDGASDAKYMSGLGPATWDSSPFIIGDGHRNEIHSGTSVVHVEGTNWLVAYMNINSNAKIVHFNSERNVHDFGAEVTPVIGVANNSLIDRPAITNQKGKLIASWLMDGQLQMVTGDIQSGEPIWQPGYLFSANVTEPGYGQPIGAHALAHDGRTFYTAVVRQRDPLPDEQITHYFLFIYTSTNGLNWTRHAFRASMNPQSMSMAARSPQDIIVILSRQMQSPVLSYHFDGTNWSVLDNNTIFGDKPMNAGHDFTLYSRK